MRILSLILYTVLASAPITAQEDASPLKAVELSVCQELVDKACSEPDRAFDASVPSVVFLTRIEGATGDAYVEHVWTLEGKVQRRVKLPLRSSPYRTWSKKTIKSLPGRWRAEVFDPVGRSLGAVDFVVRKAAGPENESSTGDTARRP